MKKFFILLVFSFIAFAISDQDTQNGQQDGEISSTKIDAGPFQYQQISSTFNTAKKDSSSSFQTFTVMPMPLIEFANSQQRITDKPEAISFLHDDMGLVSPDNSFFKPKLQIEHNDISQTPTQNPESKPKPFNEQINNLQSIDTGKPLVKPKPLIELINDLQPIVTKEQEINPLIDLSVSAKPSFSEPLGLTNIPDIEALNSSQAIATENSTSNSKQIGEFLSASQLISSNPVVLADRFTESSNTPPPFDNEAPIVNLKPLPEVSNNQQPSFSNPFDLSEKPTVNTPQLIDSIVKIVQLPESEKTVLESVSIPQPIINKPINVPEEPNNQFLEVSLQSIPQHLPFEAQPLRALVDDLNSLDLLEKPITNVQFEEPLLLSSPPKWPSGISANLQQEQHQFSPLSLVYPDADIELSRRISLAASLQRPIFQEPYLPAIDDFRLAPVTVPGMNPPFNPWNLLVPTGIYQNNWYPRPQYPVYPASNFDQFRPYGLSGQRQFDYGNEFQDNPFRISLQPFSLQSGNYLDYLERKLTHQQLQELFNSLLLNNYGKPYNSQY